MVSSSYVVDWVLMEEYSLVPPRDANEWRAYHDIRRTVLFEARGRFGVYDDQRPDEVAAGRHPRLLLCRGEAIGVVRIDIEPPVATFRRVAVRENVQRLGHGRTLLTLAEQFARRSGCTHVVSHVAPDAVEFYRKCGFILGTGESAGTESVFMSKTLVGE